MSNVTVQKALNNAIQLIKRNLNGYAEHPDMAVLDECVAALAEIEKCYGGSTPVSEPVYLISSGADEIAVSKAKYDEWTSAKRISYTSPHTVEIPPCQPRDWVKLDEQFIDAIYDDYVVKEKLTFEDFINRIQDKIKQLNTKG